MDAAQWQRFNVQKMEDLSLSQQSMEISWRVSAKPRWRHYQNIGQLTMHSTSSPATVFPMQWLQLSRVESNGVEFNGVQFNGVECSGVQQYFAIGWNNIMYSRGWIMDLDWMIPCYLNGSMSGNILMMHHMTPDRLWDCNQESMQARHHGGQ